MLLYFHKDPLGNFGDDLNPWLWPRIFPQTFSGEVFHDPALRQSVPDGETLFPGIGTLLNFGSNTGYGTPPTIDDRLEIWTSSGGVFSMLKQRMTEELVIREPKRLRKSNRARLSHEHILDDARERIAEQIERLQARQSGLDAWR